MVRRKSFGWLHKASRATQLALGVAAASLCGCGGSPPTPGGSQSGNAAGGLITAIAAGALWAVGGGCRLQGCPYGSFCDQPSGFCKVQKCSSGCPEGTVCNEGLGRCQAPPPPNPPNDFLPEDNLLLRPP